MASVYYLFDDALQIADDIIGVYSQQGNSQKENHYAAIVIQKNYRGYIGRKWYRKFIASTIVLQKYIKGWLVRYHYPEFMQERWDEICLKKYNMAATKIQAAWRGKLVRLEIDIKQMIQLQRLKLKRMDEPQLPELEMESVREVPIEDLKVEGDGGGDVLIGIGEQTAIKRRILDFMFNRHHLLSTKQRKGVLACNKELNEIEKVLKSISWKTYMTKIKKMSYKYQRIENDMKKSRYLFDNKRMRKEEDLLKLRDKTHDIKETYMGGIIADDRKRFDLHSKLVQPSYERYLFCQGPYSKRETNIVRSEDPSRNISQTGFDLALKEILKECNVPTYYIDFWYKECIGHNMAKI